MVQVATTCIECGTKGTVSGPEGMIHKTIICADCQTLLKPEVKTFSCGCQAWVDPFDGCYHFRPCAPDCALYLHAVRSAREAGKTIRKAEDH